MTSIHFEVYTKKLSVDFAVIMIHIDCCRSDIFYIADRLNDQQQIDLNVMLVTWNYDTENAVYFAECKRSAIDEPELAEQFYDKIRDFILSILS